MGLSIKDIVPRKEIEVSDLAGKTVCVDAFNILYQFLTTVRQMDGTPLMDDKGRITSHLSGILYRNTNLIENGIKLIYVFDGQAPDLKNKTRKLREESREISKEKYEQAKADEDISGMKKYSSQFIRLNDEIIAESKELLEAMGIMVIQSPSEGEAEAAYLAKTKPEIYASVSQDYDSLLFGAPKLIRSLTLAKKKTFNGWADSKPELIELDKVLNFLNLDLDQLICLGILVGTDYNPKGIPGIGQKRALQIVQRYKQPVLIFDSVEKQMEELSEEDKFDWKEIFALFHKANVCDSDINLPKMNKEKIKEILVHQHDFSEERVDKQIERLEQAYEKQKQKGLNEWF